MGTIDYNSSMLGYGGDNFRVSGGNCYRRLLDNYGNYAESVLKNSIRVA
jgi:hypothetical protein